MQYSAHGQGPSLLENFVGQFCVAMTCLIFDYCRLPDIDKTCYFLFNKAQCLEIITNYEIS